MGDKDINAQEGANKSDLDKESGEKIYVSKAEFEKTNARLEELARKNEELLAIFTSPNFMKQQEPPPKPEPQKPVAEDILPSTEELAENPAKLVTYVVGKVGKMLEEHNKKLDERDKSIAATIQKLVETDEDREAQRQIKACIEEFGEEEFNKHREDMIKIAGRYPGISARDCYLIAVGQKNPPRKAPVPKGTETEKTSIAATSKDSDLSPEEAAEKAYELHFGGKKTAE